MWEMQSCFEAFTGKRPAQLVHQPLVLAWWLGAVAVLQRVMLLNATSTHHKEL